MSKVYVCVFPSLCLFFSFILSSYSTFASRYFFNRFLSHSLQDNYVMNKLATNFGRDGFFISFFFFDAKCVVWRNGLCCVLIGWIVPAIRSLVGGGERCLAGLANWLVRLMIGYGVAAYPRCTVLGEEGDCLHHSVCIWSLGTLSVVGVPVSLRRKFRFVMLPTCETN